MSSWRPVARTWRDSHAGTPTCWRTASRTTSSSSRLISSRMAETFSPTAPRTASHETRRAAAPCRSSTSARTRWRKPVRPLGRGFPLAPALAGSTMPLPLAVRSTTDVLPIAGAWMWTKPAPADPARTLAAHLVLRNNPEHRTAQTRSGQQWINSDKRGRVNSGERRSPCTEQSFLTLESAPW